MILGPVVCLLILGVTLSSGGLSKYDFIFSSFIQNNSSDMEDHFINIWCTMYDHQKINNKNNKLK